MSVQEKTAAATLAALALALGWYVVIVMRAAVGPSHLASAGTLVTAVAVQVVLAIVAHVLVARVRAARDDACEAHDRWGGLPTSRAARANLAVAVAGLTLVIARTAPVQFVLVLIALLTLAEIVKGTTALTRRHSRRRRAGRLRRCAVHAVMGLVATVVLATTATALLDVRDARRHPAPGDLVELSDGRELHLQIAGEQHGGPTVVLEAGFGGFSTGFAWALDELADVATVVAYDRPGYGWSDPADRPVDAAATAADLHEALTTRGLAAPYVLVGHSLGAHYARVFAGRFPADVAGLVLLDPTHEDQLERVPSAATQLEQMTRALRWAPHLARVGFFRVFDPQAAAVEGLPDAPAARLAAMSVTAQHLRATAREADAVPHLAASVPTEFGALPVRIVSATEPEPGFEHERAAADVLHRELADRSPRAVHQQVAGADHMTLITDADHAGTVTRVIADLLDDLAESPSDPARFSARDTALLHRRDTH